MAKLNLAEHEAQSLRFRADMDQLKTRMLHTIFENGEDWLLDLDEAIKGLLDLPDPLPDVARFFKIGVHAVLNDYEPFVFDDHTEDGPACDS